ncbi:unnamed protein product [Ixodes persulcatus]
MAEQRKCTLSKLRGDALCAFSYGGPPCSGQGPELQPGHGGSTNLLSGSWVFYSAGGASCPPASLLSPGKAVLTVDASSTQILTANKAACALLGVMGTQVGSKRLCDFLVMKKGQYALADADVDKAGEVVVIAGKVMDLIDSDGEVVPVSVWVRKLDSDSEPRCLVVMEPVQRTTAAVTFDAARGQILTADKSLAVLCGYSEGSDLEGTPITDIIPSLVLPPAEDGVLKTVRKQQATGRTRDGGSFPLSILLEPLSDGVEGRGPPSPSPTAYRGVVWVFANISGMITVLPDGCIHSCNTNFSLMLFGYSQSQLQGKHITVVIPSFYDDFEYLDTDSVPLPPLDDDEEDSRACAFLDDRPESECSELPRPLNPLGKSFSARCSTGRGGGYASMLEDAVTSGLQDLSLTGSVTSVRQRSSTAPFQRSTSAAEPLAPLVGPSGEGGETSGTAGTSGDINGNVGLKASTSADQLDSCPLRGGGDLYSGDSSALKAETQHRGAHHVSREDSSCSSSARLLRGLVEEEEDEDDLVLPLGEVRLSTSDSFHSTSTMTSSTVHSSEENTQEDGAPRRNSWRPNNASPSPRAGEDAASGERALRAELKTFRSSESLLSIAEGSYTGQGRHRDGSHIAIVYQIRRVELEEGSSIYCLWVSRDLEVDGYVPQYPTPSCPLRSLTLGSSCSDGESSHNNADPEDPDHNAALNESAETTESEYTGGIYSDHYTTLQQIGKGAYGCVKMAYRKTDRLLVITKFIRKSKVYEESWVTDSLIGRVVPLEVSLLTTLHHPNIVRVLDVFENAGHFQMVMEKHGAGMDLFEFIDRSPCLDEPLASYVFRQVVSALSYLHGLRVLHRDVKDENIILDECFHVKLIDFGSAAFMGPDRYFTTFCGTVEYCSPEVLQGNPYAGPELEMWALGVTLYTLIFGENPFLDVEETISACLRPPYETSEELWGLLSWLLHRDPQKRCTLPEAERHPWTTQPVCPESYRFEDVVHATPEEICPSKYFQQDGSIYFSCSLYDIGKGAAAARTPSCGSSASRSSHTRVQSHGLATANPDEAADPDGAATAGASGPIYESTDILEGLESCS